jgi:hypothetical protein
MYENMLGVIELDFFKGLINGFLLSIPLWLSIFGWMKFLKNIF